MNRLSKTRVYIRKPLLRCQKVHWSRNLGTVKNVKETTAFPADSSILHQKAARAKEIHQELNVLLAKQADRKVFENNRPFGSGFLDFIKENKSEMINITAAFMCVTLAWQSLVAKRKSKDLSNMIEQKNFELNKTKRMLRKLKCGDLEDKITVNLTLELEKLSMERKHISVKDAKLPLQGVLSIFNGRNKEMDFSPNQIKNIVEIVRHELTRTLQSTIGNSTLSSTELQEKNMKELQKNTGSNLNHSMEEVNPLVQQHQKETYRSKQESSELDLTGLEDLIANTTNGSDLNSSGVVVKRNMTGFI